MTSNEAYAKSIADAETLEKEDDDKSGVITLAAMSYKNVDVGGEKKQGVLFVSGNSSLAMDFLLLEPSFGNADLMSDLIAYMGVSERIINIPARSLTSPPLTVTASQQDLIFWMFVVALPLIILAYGMVVWMRRRHL